MADYNVSSHRGVGSLYGTGTVSILEYDGYRNKLQTTGTYWLPPANLLNGLTFDYFRERNALRGYVGRNQYINNTDAVWIFDVGGCSVGVIGLSGQNIETPYVNGYQVILSPNANINNIYHYGINLTFSTLACEKTGASFICVWRNTGANVTDHDALYLGVGAVNNYTIEEMYELSQQGSSARFYGSVQIKNDQDQPFYGIEIPDESKGGGGDGDYDTSSTSNDFPSLPTLDIIGTGIVNVWNPSSYDLKLLNQWLWRDTTIFDDAKKLIDSPLSLIVSLKIIPCGVTRGEESHFCLAGQDSAINMYPVTSQFISVDCGTIYLNEYFGSALDYGAYTKIKIYLPFVGIKEISTDDCMGGAIHLKYNVDVVTGDCVACVKCIRNNLSNVLYTYGGNLAYDVPLTALNYSSKNKADVASVVGMASGLANANPAQVISGAMGIMTSKPSFERASDLKGNTGFMAIKKAFLIIERPIQSLPSGAGNYYGYPSNITAKLGNLSGYTEVDYIIQTNIRCTDNEWEEINTLLKEGVYL